MLGHFLPHQNAIRKALHKPRKTLGDTQDCKQDGGFAPVEFLVGMCVCVLLSWEACIKAIGTQPHVHAL